MNLKELFSLISRYIILLLISYPNLYLIYLIFTPATVYPLVWILSKINASTTLLEGNVLFFGGSYINIISACIAGAAYFLLLILNLTTPMNLLKRIKSLLFILLVFLALNISRIIIFALLSLKGFQYFDIAHELTWYFGSTILVVFVWFANVWIFKIRAIPIYTDMRKIFNDLLASKKEIKEKPKKILRRKVSKILHKIENKEKRKKKKLKEELEALKKKKTKKIKKK